MTLADSLSRLAADELVALGMPATTATAATRHLTEEDWACVVGGGDGRLFLVAQVAGDGAPVATVAGDAEVGERLGRGALAVDLTGVAEVALTRLNALLAMP